MKESNDDRLKKLDLVEREAVEDMLVSLGNSPHSSTHGSIQSDGSPGQRISPSESDSGPNKSSGSNNTRTQKDAKGLKKIIKDLLDVADDRVLRYNQDHPPKTMEGYNLNIFQRVDIAISPIKKKLPPLEYPYRFKKFTVKITLKEGENAEELALSIKVLFRLMTILKPKNNAIPISGYSIRTCINTRNKIDKAAKDKEWRNLFNLLGCRKNILKKNRQAIPYVQSACKYYYELAKDEENISPEQLLSLKHAYNSAMELLDHTEAHKEIPTILKTDTHEIFSNEQPIRKSARLLQREDKNSLPNDYKNTDKFNESYITLIDEKIITTGNEKKLNSNDQKNTTPPKHFDPTISTGKRKK